MSINDPRNPALRSRDLPWNDTPAAPTTPDPVKALLEVLGDPDHTEQCAHGVSEAGCIIEGLRERGYAISPAHSIEAEARAFAPLDVTPEQLANAMAAEGYADPDWNEQWAAPVEAARCRARLTTEGEKR